MSERSRSPSEERIIQKVRTKKIKRQKYDEVHNRINETTQSKITCYIKPNNNPVKKAPLKPNQKLIQNLQKQLQQLEEIEDNLIKKKESLIEEESRKNIVFNNMLKKSKVVIEVTLSEIYQAKREEKKKVDLSKGYYNPQQRQYVNGYNTEESIVKLNEWNRIIGKKKGFEKEMIEELIEEEQKKLKKIELQNMSYKDQLKLAHEQEHCRFSKNWPLINKKFLVLQLVGKGGFSEVYRAYNLQNNTNIALKVSSLTNFRLSSNAPNYITHVMRQYETHKELHHQNIAQLLQIVQVDSDSICLALQFCDGPQLSNYLKKHKVIPEKKAKQILRQILSALNYLYGRQVKIIHYDLKPSNIMFHEGKIKILDFGLCKLIDNEHSRIALTAQGAGTYWYLPPETFDETNPTITSKVDVWSTGVIFYELLFGERPFGHNMSQQNILNNRVILNALDVQFPKNKQLDISEAGKQFIRQCLKYDPSERLDPKQAYKHRYFSDIDMFQ